MALGRTNSYGNPLNFKIVKNPQPENPRENTIWLDTDVKVSEWYIGSKNPFLKTQDVYDSNKIKTGYYINANGVEATAAGFSCTEMIDIPGGAVRIMITASSAETSSSCHAFYDTAGTFISSVKRMPGKQDLVIPAGAAKIRATFKDYDTKAVLVDYIAGTEGAVWIEDGVYSPVSYNALTKNTMTVNPLTARQILNGKLVDVPAQIYQSGEWRKWITYLYHDGTEYQTFTITEQYADNVSYVKNAESISFHMDRADVANRVQGFYIEVPEKKDFTPYKTLKCEVSRDVDVGSCMLGVTQGTAANSDVTSKMIASSYMSWDGENIKQVCSLDVSEINEAAYPIVRLYATGNTTKEINFEFTNWWLE